MNIKKMFTTLSAMVVAVTMTMPSVSVFGATYTAELEGAYDWAHEKWITTMSSIDNANMYGNITRAEMAKMLSVYATEVLGLTPDTSAACTFTDIDSVKGDLHDYIIKSCQLGIMGQGISAFRPYDTLVRAEFGTALSRLLWGGQYEGGTPYYAKHLDALKSAGIMNQIANAETTKEVRGYVMLMLQRSEANGAGVDCEDTDVVLACLDDINNCPAACKAAYDEEDNTETEDGEVVKSGSLVVDANGDSNGNLFIGRDSELDVITLKTSEEVTISRIVLERIGYSTKDNIVSVKLEDTKWATIADAKTLDSKGQVKLTLKKDYKVVDGELEAVIVVNTVDTGANALAAGATVGFKVVDVESTAKNLDITGKANTYTAIKFDGSKLTFTNFKPTATKDYNWTAGEIYEVAKFKVTAPDDSSIVLRGFTFSKGTSTLDIRKYFDSAEVTIAGEKVKNLEATVNKDDELVVTFKDVEVPAKSKSEVIVKIALTEDFDQFLDVVRLSLKDFVAVDGKVSSRVSTTNTLNAANEYYGYFPTYTFKGGKIKLTNVKLGNVDAAQNSEDILIAEGTIEVPETIKGTFTIEATGIGAWAIKEMTVVINGEETDANSPKLVAIGSTTATVLPSEWSDTVQYTGNTSKVVHGGLVYVAGSANPTLGTFIASEWTLTTTTYAFTFNNVEIEKSGKVKFYIDTYDNASWNGQTINNISIFKADRFITAGPTCNLVYDESNKPACAEMWGSISFSKVTIQPAKASMTNTMTKEVEFANKASNRKVVFEGTYTAKKGDVKLNEFVINKLTSPTTSAGILSDTASNKVTFYVYVDGDEVADSMYNWSTNVASETFDNVLVEAGESVSVKVEAEVEADNATLSSARTIGKFSFTIKWEDVNGNENSGVGTANTVTMKLVEKGSINVSAGSVKETVLYKAANAEIAAFTIKPANGMSETDLEEISFTITDDTYPIVAQNANVDGKVTVKVNNVTADDCIAGAAGQITCSFNETVNSDGSNVVISLDNETTGIIEVTNLYINGKSQTRTFKKRFESALVWIDAMKDLGGTTEFTLGVEKDSELDVRNLTLTFDLDESGSSTGTTTNKAELPKSFDNWDTIEGRWIADKVRLVTQISYLVTKAGDYYDASTTSKCAAWTTGWTVTAGGTATQTASDAGSNYCLVTITKVGYTDFFKVGDTYARVYKSN